ncbi:MAG: hypothetical protein U5K27_17285 [Desulfotignum sp.]|nr:hypothetical protein [Desulfotignum sp.]
MIDNQKILITRKYPAAGKGIPLGYTPDAMSEATADIAFGLPHVGSGTMEARDRMSVLAAENIIEFYKTGRVPHIVNPEVLA